MKKVRFASRVVERSDASMKVTMMMNCASYDSNLVSCKNQINQHIARKLMHILVHVLPKTQFIDLEYFANTLLTLARLKTLTAFFSEQ